MSPLIDMTGRKVGRLTVIRRDTSQPHLEATWLCECECGSTALVGGSSLRRTKGGTRSCGCIVRKKETRKCQTCQMSRPLAEYANYRALCNSCRVRPVSGAERPEPVVDDSAKRLARMKW